MWQPGASRDVLRARATLLASVREFFLDQDVLEVTTPVLGNAGVTDPHIDGITAIDGQRAFHLQTSPEYAMKRLLAAGSGPIYQVCPAFRGGESGVRHNTEFLMLEWYRPGFTLDELMSEVEALVGKLMTTFAIPVAAEFGRCSLASLFLDRYGWNPHTADKQALASAVATLGDASHIDDHDDAGTTNDFLDYLFATAIEPTLTEPTFIFDYAASQAALAEIGENANGDRVARRFELVWRGVELANGYQELRDPAELRERMRVNNEMRKLRGKPAVAPDEKLLAALPQMPPSCGVALGLDRILMLLLGKAEIDEVLPFSVRRL